MSEHPAVHSPVHVDERSISVAYGHAIANVDTMGQMAALVPGGSAARMEAQLYGSVQPRGPVQVLQAA